jgi:predicted tellurium resistance membrane protein TerC
MLFCFLGWCAMRLIDEDIQDEGFWSMPMEGWAATFFAGILVIVVIYVIGWGCYCIGELIIK